MIGAAVGLDVKVDPRLRETHLGQWQGRTIAEIEAGWPGAIAEWRSDPAWAPPGGESRIEVVRRSRPVVDELDEEYADNPEGIVVVVAHGGMIAGPGVRPPRPAHLHVAVDRRHGQLPLGRARAPRRPPPLAAVGLQRRLRRRAVVPGPTLLVLADSLAFHGPERAEPADDPRLWPNVAAAALGGRAELVAGIGWTARHAWQALIRDPRIWAMLPRVDALVLGVGGMDTLPSPLPTALRELLPVVRPDGLRRVVRPAYRRLQPGLARAFARTLPGGGPVALPPRLTVRHLEQCRAAVLAIRPGMPVVAVLPPVHRAAEYARVHVGRPPRNGRPARGRRRTASRSSTSKRSSGSTC